MKLSLDGLGDIAKNLTKEGADFQLSDILSADFFSKNTSFASLGEFLKGGGFGAISGVEGLSAIPIDSLNQFTKGNSKFGSWAELLEAAKTAFLKNKLGQ